MMPCATDRATGFAVSPDCPCACTAAPIVHDPDDVVTALVRACEARDLEAVTALVTNDIEYDNVPIGKVFGPEGVRTVLSGGVTEAASAVEWVVHRQVSSGSTVMNERTDRFLVGGRWIEISIHAVFEVRDGRVSLWRDHFDLETYRLQRQASV